MRRRLRSKIRLLSALIFLAAAGARADLAPVPGIFAQRAQENYQAARARYKSRPQDAEAAWQFGRACFDCADLARHESDKAAYAEEGAYACRQALVDKPNSAWAHYYLGLDIGELAQSRGLGALRLLRDMESEWKAAIRLDGRIDYAGPERSLGMLYRDAPGWPLSLGSRGRAIEYLTAAIRLSPDYPDNWLTLAEAYLKWNEYRPAGAVAAHIPGVLARARQQLSGPNWQSSWFDWTRRWQAIQDRLNQTSRPQSPHEGK